MILATLLLALAPERPERMTPPPRPPAQFIRYVSTWRTRYAIDGVEVDLADVERRFATLEVEEVKVGGDGWQIRWLLFRTKGE